MKLAGSDGVSKILISDFTPANPQKFVKDFISNRERKTPDKIKDNDEEKFLKSTQDFARKMKGSKK